MSARQLAHVCLFLFGVYLIVESLADLTSLINQRPLLVYAGDDPLTGVSAYIAWSSLVAVTSFLLLGLLPGGILISWSERWAEAWIPETDASEITLSILLPVGLLLLGLRFGIVGLATLAGGAARAAMGADVMVAFGARSIVYLAAGVALFLFGRRLARNAG
jgi:hypothetical protein